MPATAVAADLCAASNIHDTAAGSMACSERDANAASPDTPLSKVELMSPAFGPVATETSDDHASSAGAAEIAGHNLLIAEEVNAHLCGGQLLQYQVTGELQLLPSLAPSLGPVRPSEFRFRFKNAHRIEQIKVNDKFVRVVGGSYLVQLPRVQLQQPIPLIKYATNARWRPVPVFLELSSQAVGPSERVLRATIQPNPQLKTPLQNVLITVSPSLQDTHRVVAEQGSWDVDTQLLQWRIAQVASGEHPTVRTAQLTGNEKIEILIPSQLQFGCEGVTISGIELEVQTGAAGNPIARLVRRFASGDYKVSTPEPSSMQSRAPTRAMQVASQ